MCPICACEIDDDGGCVNPDCSYFRRRNFDRIEETFGHSKIPKN